MNRYALVVFLVASCTEAIPQTKSVKGGQGNFPYDATANLMRFYGTNGTQGTSFNNAQGYYGNSEAEYINSRTGQTNSQNEFEYGQSGYSNAQSEHNQVQGGYFQNQSGYNQTQSGYNHAQGGYNNAQSGYNNAQGGYNGAQNGYDQAQSGYNQANGGYNNPQNVYTYSQDGVNQPQGGYNQLLGSNGTQGRFNTTQNSSMLNYERGVCYIEVPTAQLVRDRTHIPAGNGSRPDLSRIRGCCKGYIRNIHNFRICEPVCTEECVNGLCTAPDTCTCFPNHVRNAGGFCIPTCPIGCQHGTCAGGECLCKQGYKLDDDGKYCLPVCKDNCGKQGNCTAPDTCECKKSYRSTPSGGCAAHCDSCKNGDCVGPNVCQCKQGYKEENGDCIPVCVQGCGSNGRCIGPNVCECPKEQEFDATNKQCKPKCTRKCDNGDCVGVNTCRCHQGYTNSEAGNCIPVCNQRCGPNGDCVAPNNCSCHPGYNKNQFGECTPSCEHGECASFETQQSQSLDQFSQCSLPCINGFCSGNVCICNTGYQLDRTDPSGTRCIPSCPGGCPNGTCSAPNFCICNSGYVKDRSVKGQQNCIKRNKRSINQPNIADLLTYNIPDY